jgi:hypothetical protein
VNAPFVIVGGVAVAVLARPRTTLDVDAIALLDDSALDQALDASRRHGIEPRIRDAAAFARKQRVLLLRHAQSGTSIDVTLALIPFEREAIARARPSRIGDLEIPLPTAEDLVIMKAIARRTRDVADVEAILAAYPALDVSRVRRIVREFAAALEAPEVIEELERALKSRRG